MRTSVFDLFRIGVGPSSSHTVGPMRAAREFALSLSLTEVATLRTELYGSLALTGRGHATDRAILLGLSGQTPAGVDPECITSLVEAIRTTGTLNLLGQHPIPFREPEHLPPGLYSVLVTGVNTTTTGVALVGIYEIP